ncbi:MAG TPA: DNA replication protein DnaC [Eubacteriaceae bacterium]|nr:DNA replication protein DnaC [Eubacteriaceae bacterium]
MREGLYQKAMIEFNENNLARQRAFSNRKEKIFQDVPELKTIANELSALGLRLVRLSMSGATDEIQKTKAQIEAKKKKEKELLSRHGYPANFLEYHPHCSLCEDTGYIDGKICKCFNRLIIEKYYERSNLKKRIEKENFDTFDLGYYSTNAQEHGLSPKENIEKILSVSLDFVKHFDQNESNLYFFGEPGLGKTFLSHCIAKELLDKGHTVIYHTASDLIDIIRQSKLSDSGDLGLRDLLYDSDLLIIDDLGTEHLTEFANHSLFNLINQRLIDGRKMIISTNLPIGTLQKRYSTRLASRIIGNFHFLHFFGDDIRMKKADLL